MTLQSPSRKRKPSSSSSQDIARGSSISSQLPTHGKRQKASSKKKEREQESNGIPPSTAKNYRRVFMHEDEILILQGMLDCGTSKATQELFRFLDGKLSDDFSNQQLSEKVRRLKEKFFKNMDNADSLKTHDALVFAFCNRIWGNGKVLGTGLNKQKTKKKNPPRNPAMKDAGEDFTKEKLLEEIACIVKKYEMKAKLAKLDYEQMMKE